MKASGRRKTISIDVIPSIILEALPDNSQVNLKEAIKHLPLHISAPLMMYFVLSASQREIAIYLNISQMDVSRKINMGIDIIKEMATSDQ